MPVAGWDLLLLFRGKATRLDNEILDSFKILISSCIFFLSVIYSLIQTLLCQNIFVLRIVEKCLKFQQGILTLSNILSLWAVVVFTNVSRIHSVHGKYFFTI